MAAISAFRVTQHSQIFNFSSEIKFNALSFINYTIPWIYSTYAVATLVQMKQLLLKMSGILLWTLSFLIVFGAFSSFPGKDKFL